MIQTNPVLAPGDDSFLPASTIEVSIPSVNPEALQASGALAPGDPIKEGFEEEATMASPSRFLPQGSESRPKGSSGRLKGSEGRSKGTGLKAEEGVLFDIDPKKQ
mmetsp:Transcript_589/g.671  ORF Transcript_589/g.671 Transcript_589/m.671 type:complete len:105 (+) Transcript_589:515-829(+)